MNHLRLLTRDLAASLEVDDFDKCVLLDASIEDLNKILKRTRIPQRECRSRDDVEINIMELQFAVESIGMSDPDLTLSYQNRTSVYKGLRSMYPTAAELKQRIVFAQQELQTAISAKQFRKCSELKNTIAKFEEELTLLSGDKVVQYNQIMTVIDIRRIFVSLEIKMSEALAAHNFEVCEEIQREC